MTLAVKIADGNSACLKALMVSFLRMQEKDHECEVQIDKSVIWIIVWHHSVTRGTDLFIPSSHSCKILIIL